MDKAFVAELHRRKREGHTYAPLRVQRKTKPKNWDRVRVFPGVYGRCIGEMDHWYLIDVPLDALLDYAGSLPSRARANAAVMGEAIPLMKVMQVNGEFENGQGHLCWQGSHEEHAQLRTPFECYECGLEAATREDLDEWSQEWEIPVPADQRTSEVLPLPPSGAAPRDFYIDTKKWEETLASPRTKEAEMTYGCVACADPISTYGMCVRCDNAYAMGKTAERKERIHGPRPNDAQPAGPCDRCGTINATLKNEGPFVFCHDRTGCNIRKAERSTGHVYQSPPRTDSPKAGSCQVGPELCAGCPYNDPAERPGSCEHPMDRRRGSPDSIWCAVCGSCWYDMSWHSPGAIKSVTLGEQRPEPGKVHTKFTIEGEQPVRPVAWRAVGPWRSDFRMAQADAEPVVWADEASPFTGAQVKDLLDENERLRQRSETAVARPFQAGDIITFLQACRFRIDSVTMRDGKQRAEMTMIVDDMGHKGEWQQLGGPCSLKDAVVVPTGGTAT